MKAFICIDDTDNLESIGTGHLAAAFIVELEEKGWGTGSFITRHQLYVHPDVPYTSHNSAMCFEANLEEGVLERVIEHGASFLRQYSATGSDPGLCVAVPDRLADPAEIIDFGRRAKQEVLHKEAAYGLALRQHIHLSEHGGTGSGVIGALAGVGLRLGGNDGRIRGKLQVASEDGTAEVASICSQAKVDSVQSMSGELLSASEKVLLGEKIKAIYQAGRPVLLVAPLEAPRERLYWRTCTKEELRVY